MDHNIIEYMPGAIPAAIGIVTLVLAVSCEVLGAVQKAHEAFRRWLKDRRHE